MKFSSGNKYFKWGLTAFLVIAASMTFYYLIFNSSSIKANAGTILNILMPVVFGLGIAYILTPILNFMEEKILNPFCEKMGLKKTKRRNGLVRGIGILVTCFFALALIYALVAMLISQIVPSVEGVIVNFDAYSNNVIKWINQMLEDNPEFGDYVTKAFDTFSEQLEGWLRDLIPSTASLIMSVSLSVINLLDVLKDFIIGFIISVYVLASKERFAGQAKKLCYAAFKQDTANVIIRNFRFTHRTFIGFLGGKIVDSIIIGLLCFIGTSIMKTPYAVLISVIIGFTNIIPFFGPFLGAIPSIVLIFAVDPTNPLNCLYFVIFVLALQQFDGNILGPKILGSSTGLAGFWVIFAITLFGGLMGVFGMIVGVPVFAVLYAAAKAVVNTMLEKKHMPKETKDYEEVDYVDESGFHELEPEQKRRDGKPNSAKGHRLIQEGFHFKWISRREEEMSLEAKEKKDHSTEQDDEDENESEE